MNSQSFYRLLQNPDLLDSNSLSELEQLVEAYPYSENIRILYTLNLLVLEDFKYEQNLAKTAFISSDRRKLKYLVDTLQKTVINDFTELSEKLDPYPSIINIEDKNEGKHVELKENKIEEPIKYEQDETSFIETKEIQQKKEKETPVVQSDILQKKETKEDNQEGSDFKNSEESIAEEKKRVEKLKKKAELLQRVQRRLQEIEDDKKNFIKTEDGENEVEENLTKNDLIDRFIREQPSISRPDKKDFFSPQNQAIESSIDEMDFLVTETLATIHSDQGNLQKAIEIYQKLILKFPEKSSYFAARIQDLSK